MTIIYACIYDNNCIKLFKFANNRKLCLLPKWHVEKNNRKRYEKNYYLQFINAVASTKKEMQIFLIERNF